MNTPTEQKSRGFTLIELLVVISIIALLVSILLPALGNARKQAQMAVCLSHEKQIYTSFYMYAMSNRDYLPPAYAGGNWNVIYDFVRDYLEQTDMDTGGEIFYCPAVGKDQVVEGVEDAWETSIDPGNGADCYYIGYQLFCHPVRADFPINSLDIDYLPLANGIDTIPGYSNSPTLSWHYYFTAADPALRNVVPATKITDTLVKVGINGEVHRIPINPSDNPILFDQAMSRDGEFDVYEGDTVHDDGKGGCYGINAAFMDGHAETRRSTDLKVLRDYGSYGIWDSLQKWF